MFVTLWVHATLLLVTVPVGLDSAPRLRGKHAAGALEALGHWLERSPPSRQRRDCVHRGHLCPWGGHCLFLLDAVMLHETAGLSSPTFTCLSPQELVCVRDGVKSQAASRTVSPHSQGV